MIVSMRSSKNFNKGVDNHQSVQAKDHEDSQVSGQVTMNARRHGSRQSLRHVNIESYDQKSK